MEQFITDVTKMREAQKEFFKINQWINVNDKLPNNKQLVLFRCENGLILSGLFYELDEMYRPNIFHDYTAPYPLGFITHWMTVPESIRKVNLREAIRLETIVDNKLKGLQRSEKVPTTGELFKSDNL